LSASGAGTRDLAALARGRAVGPIGPLTRLALALDGARDSTAFAP
jgi:hypothetical protein